MSRDLPESETGRTIRSKCGRARLTFRPDWSATLPWIAYVDGTAGKHYGFAVSGAFDLQRRGFTFPELKKTPCTAN